MMTVVLNTLMLPLLLLVVVSVNSQRVAPGVPPQHYQQVPVQHGQPQQQYHQPPQQMQVAPGVAPQHYQAPPEVQYQQTQYQQQQHQQVPIQQVPQGQPHVQQQQQQHFQRQGHGQPQQVLNAANVQHERAHIQEHMQVPIDTSKMSEAELQFHYFKMHDSDNNNKLDGCELIKSLIHWHEQGSKDSQHHDQQQPHVEEKIFTDEELTALIDPILQMDDTSRDGYIDYPEFMRAQQKSAAQHQQQQQQQPQQQQGGH